MSHGAQIRPIDQESVHRICSNQVILDLATAVKELVENSLDAGATTVEVRLKEYGSEIIEIADNGCGIDASNYEALALKHWTSKLRQFSDLESVASFGFRGEALSSLCAVSSLSVSTKCAHDPIGMDLIYNAEGVLVSKKPCARTMGTTLTVKDLFRSLPVRHKAFTKHLKREYSKLVGVLHSYALTCTGVRFTCVNTVNKSRQAVFSTTGSNLMDHITSIYGAKQGAVLEPIEINLETEKAVYEERAQKRTGDSPSGDSRGPGTSRKVALLHRQGSVLFESKRPASLGFSSPPKRIKGQTNEHEDEEWAAENTNRNELNVGDGIAEGGMRRSAAPESGDLSSLHGYVIKGYISRQLPKCGRATPDRQHWYLNGRPVDIPRLSKTINDLYRQFNNHTQYPFCVLDFRLPSGRFDVNVTPNKRMVFVHHEWLCCEIIKDWLTRKYEPTQNTYLVKSIRDHLTGMDSPATVPASPTGSFSGSVPISPIGSVPASPVISPYKATVSTTPVRSPPTPTLATITSPTTSVNPSSFDDDDDAWFAGTEPETTSTQASVQRTTNKKRVAAVDLRLLGKRPKRIDALFPALEKAPVPEELNSREDVNLLSEDGEPGEDGVSVSDENRTYNNSALDDQAHSNNTENDQAYNMSPGHSTSVHNISADGDQDFTVGDNVCEDGESRESLRCYTSAVFLDFWAIRQRLLAPKWNSRSGVNSLVSRTVCRKQDAEDERIREDLANKKVGDKEPSLGGAAEVLNEDTLRRVITKDDFKKMEVLGQFNLGFIITRLADDLFIIDQHATDEKYRFELLQRTTTIKTQPLIRPMPLEITASEELTIMQHLDVFRANGFEFLIEADKDEQTEELQGEERVVGRQFRVRLVAVPFSKNITFGVQDIQQLCGLLDAGGVDPSNPPVIPKIISMFASRACRTAVMIGKALTKAHMGRIVGHMAEMEHPWNCPHGRPTMRHLHTLIPDSSRTV